MLTVSHIAANDPATVLALIAVAEELQRQCDACDDDACELCGSKVALDRLTEVLNRG